MSAGIDYGRGLTNIDHVTGIRYGVISPHSIMGEAFHDIYDCGKNLSYVAALEDMLASLPEDATDEDREQAEDEFNNSYTEDDDAYRYEREGYIIETTSLGLYIIKSPYYTLAKFCSPCCPGAGNLDSPSADGVKTYCLGADWFEDEKAPYPIHEVDND